MRVCSTSDATQRRHNRRTTFPTNPVRSASRISRGLHHQNSRRRLSLSAVRTVVVSCGGGPCPVQAESFQMAYQFPPDVDQLVKERMALGVYTSEDEVLRDALGALEQLEQERLARWDERNRLAIKQSKQGLSRTLDDQRVLASLRERLAREGILE
jgi:Arc/MetJ-type ribon-helix-helix transcriptional regulator